MTSPLAGLHILDATQGLAGGFCTMLLADLGAEVIRVADAVPATWRQTPPVAADDPAFAALHRNKSGQWLDLGSAAGRAKLKALSGGADAFIEDFAPGVASAHGFGPADLGRSGLIYASLSAFGQTGPLKDQAACDLVVQAITGGMDITGEPGRPPVTMGLALGDEISGLLCAIAILGAAERRARSGEGAVLDLSSFDANLAMLSYMTTIYFATGRSPERLGSSHPTIFPYCAFKTADGHVVAAPFTQNFWRKFCAVLGREDLPQDPRFRGFKERLERRPELSAIIDPIMASATSAEWLARLDRGDVPNGPLNSLAEAIEMEQTRARGMVASAGGTRMLGSAFHFDFEGKAAFKPEYRPYGEGTSDWATQRSADPAATAKPGAALLDGIRVLDLTRMFAGPYCGAVLADLGADVIKIEEPRIGDPTRRNIPIVNGESTYYMAVNRGKRSITLDLKQPEGLEAFLGLVAEADVVVENFRPGVMDRLGASYQALRKVNPDIVMLSLSGFGQTGPLRDKISFDLVNQAMAGVMAITGEPGREPVRIGLPVGDLSGGIFGAFGVIAALRARRLTGRGAALDLSLHDLLVSLTAPMAARYLRTGISPGPMGSSHPDMVPHRAYRAADGWMVLAARSDMEWQELAAALGEADLGADPRFRTAAGRREHRAALDAALEQAIATRPLHAWLDRLVQHGVPAARVASMGEALDSDHAQARGILLSYDHTVAGRCRSVGTGIVVDGRPAVAALPPPALGEHNDAVLGGLLGLSPGQIATLRTPVAAQ